MASTHAWGSLSFASWRARVRRLFSRVRHSASTSRAKRSSKLRALRSQDRAMALQLAEVWKAANTLKLRLVEREVTRQSDVERVFGSLKSDEVQGVFVASSSLVTKFPSLVLRLALERHLPVPSHRKEWVEKGALFSYGANFHAVGQNAATYVDKRLRGVKPADLPVEQVMRLELVINLKTAKALGLTIPQPVLIRADELIR
jgi:putative ABC transport system substrate-binding protein